MKVGARVQADRRSPWHAGESGMVLRGFRGWVLVQFATGTMSWIAEDKLIEVAS